MQPRHFQLLLMLLDGKAEIRKKSNSKLVMMDSFKSENLLTGRRFFEGCKTSNINQS
jgi:hypothetical protein